MAVKISLMQDTKNPMTKRVLRYLARHFKKHNVLVLVGNGKSSMGQVANWWTGLVGNEASGKMVSYQLP